MPMSDGRDEVASFYDEHGESLGLTDDYRHLEPVLPSVSNKRVLDAGCGLGDGSAYFAENGADVIGIDISQAEIEQARKRHGERVDFHVGDLRNPLSRFDGGAFDLVVCALTLAHLQNWDQPFQEFRRILKESGAVVLHAHHPFIDYLELAGQDSAQVSGTGGTYTEIERFTRPWGPNGESLQFHRRPLGELLRPALDAGFLLEKLIEPGTGPYESERYDPADPPRHLLLRFCCR